MGAEPAFTAVAPPAPLPKQSKHGSMIAGLIHKVRNPLGALQMMANHLAAHVTDEESRSLAGMMMTEIHRTSEMLSRAALADYAPRRQYARVRLEALVAQAIAAVEADRPDASPQIVMISDGCSAPDGSIEGDAPLLALMVEQLVQNASESGSALVEVHIEHHEDRAVIAVIDWGAGLSSDAGDPFTPFFTTKPGHPGLGLNVAARIAHAHDGFIGLKSLDGGGSMAVVSLPSTQKTPAEREIAK